ncbi:hypothetical protein C8R45DRAFT_570000 [Mycena sanguinolenta]|nr:hypothetical protein C8R45DRAFT_570000 [Mycena sanguinolenta]
MAGWDGSRSVLCVVLASFPGNLERSFFSLFPRFGPRTLLPRHPSVPSSTFASLGAASPLFSRILMTSDSSNVLKYPPSLSTIPRSRPARRPQTRFSACIRLIPHATQLCDHNIALPATFTCVRRASPPLDVSHPRSTLASLHLASPGFLCVPLHLSPL